jgi:magnesium-transporting ATPase (P-type)
MKNKALDLNWHSMSAEETLLHLETSLDNGLNDEQVSFRQEYFGKNILPKKSAISLARIFFGQFKNALIYILLVAVIVSLLVQEYSDGALIMVVLLVNAIIGTVQEYNAEQNAANLNSLITVKARVRRNGQIISLDAAELVVGDIVILTAGNKVPADLRLLETNQLKINESLLTGESQSILKNHSVLAGELAIGDRVNLAYSGSQVNYGQGVGVVVACGMTTQIGMIATAILHEEGLPPPLVVRMERFTRQLAVIVLLLCIVFAVVAIFRGFVWHQVLFLSIALAVSAIPEGLPIAITVALSIATKKMVKRQVLVRKLAAVEGLGSCNIIASDKTGTLTVNRQLIRRIWLSDASLFNVTGEGYDDQGEISLSNGEIKTALPNALQMLIVAGCAANEAELFYSDSEQKWKHSGDEVDLAFLALGYKAGILPRLKKQLMLKELTPYLSERKFSGKILMAA